MESENIFLYDFSFLNRNYSAEIFPTYELSEEEKLEYKIQGDSFFVRLETPNGMKFFELYVAEDLEWHTHSTDSELHDEIIQVLGEYVDCKTM